MFILFSSGFSQKISRDYAGFELNNIKKVKTLIYSQSVNFLPQATTKHKAKTLSQIPTGSVTDIADEYIHNNQQFAQFENKDFRFEVVSEQFSPGGTHITYHNFYRGIPVYNSEVVISLNKDKKVTFVAAKIRSGIELKNIQPGMTSVEAITLARDYLNVSGKLHAEQRAELMIFDSGDRGTVLTYRVEIPVTKPRGDWEIFVEAFSGEVIHVSNRMMFDHLSDGTGAVWDTDPLTMAAVYYGGEFVDDDDNDLDSLNNQRVLVSLRDITYVDSLEGYILSGPYVRLTDRDPDGPIDIFPVNPDPHSFIYARSQQEFEDVMVYYHLDKSYRRLQSLGFEIEGLAEFQADPHGLNGEDNSYYSPYGNFCAFGEGGVDDAEDAAVLWHEYAHAIQENIVPMVDFGETFSLKEGSSDYWAVSYKRRTGLFGWEQVYLWDAGIMDEGGYAFWAGRRCDLNWHYPEDYQLFQGTHEGGQIWSSALMHIWDELGADITDELFLAAHYYWGSDPGFQGAAQAFIQADIDINGGDNFDVISYWFEYHGLINIENYQPQILHTPLTDTEVLQGSYPVICRILPAAVGLDTTDLWLYWSTDSIFSDSVLLSATGEEGAYMAEIPGITEPGYIHYYIHAGDSLGQASTAPESAPQQFFTFYAGPDTIPPIIIHSPLENISLSAWPYNISAQISDNIYIDSVWVEYMVRDTVFQYSFALSDNDSSGFFSGQFYADSGNVQAGDTIYYCIFSVDSSQNANLTRLPEYDYYHFTIYQIPPAPANLQIIKNHDVIQLGWDHVLLDHIYYNIYKSADMQSFFWLDSTVLNTYTDSSAGLGDTCYYYLTTMFSPWESVSSDTIQAIVEAVVGIPEPVSLPVVFKLEQNAPNPFNPQTKIRYQLAKGVPVKLEIFNILGQKIKTLVNQFQSADFYQVVWDGRSDNGNAVAGGIYIYHLKAGDFVRTRKMLFLK